MNVISYNYQLKTLQTFKTIVMDNQRRIFEEQRKKRIFNAKQRQIGLDIKTLNQQVYENHLHRTRVAENEGNLAEKAKNYNSMAILINQQRKKEIREQCKDIDVFRLTVQKPEYSRDFDLFDPNQKRQNNLPEFQMMLIVPFLEFKGLAKSRK
ncbi:RIB43A-like with coiled-coils protein 2 [Caerostris darwini]|uniref:RIB43A-like with coiled-coils protein 2 n=1 Tax=Caerostris darwini TaxID=1538125 RepID=A0AAV4N1W7_9ARAC|nr:RIB43A-like with coiled-coils protein 2 [Caerostris darwini]